MTDATSGYLNRPIRLFDEVVIDLAAARRARGLPPPKLTPLPRRSVFAAATADRLPAGIAIGDRVFIRSCGVYGTVTGAERLPNGHWHLAVLSAGVTYSCTDLTVEPAPDTARA